MSDGFAFTRNTFQETLLGLEYSPRCPADLFSRACAEAFAESDRTRFGYPFTQVFEPGVLHEIAVLADVPYPSLTGLDPQPTAATRQLAATVAQARDLSAVEVINVASALVSISRFDLATRLLVDLAERELTPRESFEAAWLDFMISNRCDDGASSPAAFARMGAAIDAGGVPAGRVLDACTQAVVWYLKRQEVPLDVFRWAVRTGGALAKRPDRLDQGTVSSWYRGIAMLPAAKGRAAETRRFMALARDAAQETIAERPRAFEMNTIKTYYESAVKEHMYVTGDADAAEQAGLALIELDPVWSPSYGELAEAYQRFGQVDRAAGYYERAAQAGPPYVGYHLLKAAQCRAKLGQDELALDHYVALLRLVPGNAAVVDAGLELALRLAHPCAEQFADARDRRQAQLQPGGASAA
jgi:hypothetical protein